MQGLIESGSFEVIAGILLLVFAYFLPGIFLTYDRKEGIRLLEERESAKQGNRPAVWTLYILTIVLWPFTNWEKIDTYQNWATYMRQEKEEDDEDSSV